MALRKLSAEQLFTGLEIVENKVLILDADNCILDIVDQENAGENVEIFNGIISPAFINCHCHLELSHMKNVAPEASGLMDFVSHIMHMRQFPLEEIKDAIAKADQEMYDNGIVAVGDICNTSHTLATKSSSKITYRNFIEIAGFVPNQADARWKQGSQLKKQMEEVGISTIVPHAPYSVSEQLFEKINKDSVGKTISIHNQESQNENLLYQEKKGAFLHLYENMKADISFFHPSRKTSIQTYLPWLNIPEKILLVHDTFSSLEDIQYAESLSKQNGQKLYWTLCPNANWYIERLLPPVEILRKEQVKICIGTDSIASNYDLSVLSELQRIRSSFTDIPIVELLQWATLNGAEALSLDDHLGSFEKGKQPGVIQITSDFSKVKRLI